MRFFDYSIFAGKRVGAMDVDMSLVNNRERRRLAEARGRAQGKEVDYSFFNDVDNLALDRPMTHRLALLWHGLDTERWDVLVYISSRPDFMWYGTAVWLRQYAFPFPFHVLLRKQYMKTLQFKREELETIARIALHVDFVDDAELVRQATASLAKVTVFAQLEDVFSEGEAAA